MSDVLREVILPRLEGVRPSGGGYAARCPAHDDRAPSLSISAGKQQPVVLNCQAGCSPDAVLAALGLSWSDLNKPRDRPKRAIAATYPYVDEHGTVLFEKIRYEPKDFRQRRPDGRGGWIWSLGDTRRVLYRLPDVLDAVRDGRTVYLVEGEKDVHAAEKAGAVATCNFDGAAKAGAKDKWRPEYGDALKGAHVVIVADNDAAGLAHARAAFFDLKDKAASVRIARGLVDVEHADLSDHLAAGHSLDDLTFLETSQDDGDVISGEVVRRVRSQPLTQIARRRRRYLWQHRVPIGEVTLWVGHAGIGKSQAAVWLAAKVSRGELEGDLHGAPASVLYLGTEDSWEYTLAPRFDAAGADPTKIFRLYVETEHGEDVVSLAVDMDTLRQEIEATGAKLVVLDALLSTFGSAKLTEQGTVRRHLEPLARLAQEMGIAIVGVAHFRKASDSNPLHMISGSSEFGQVVRSAIGFAPDRESEDGSCILSLIKTNIAPSGLPSLRYRIEPCTVETPEGDADVGRFVPLGETDQDIEDVLNRERTSAEDRSEVDECAGWLLGFLKEKGKTPRAEVMKAGQKESFSDATIKRAKGRAKVRHESTGFPRTTVWVHPDVVTDGDGTVGSSPNEPTGDEPTEPTEPTCGNTDGGLQLAQTRVCEPTGAENGRAAKNETTQSDGSDETVEWSG